MGFDLSSFTQAGSTWDNSRLVKDLVSHPSMSSASFDSSVWASASWIANETYFISVRRSSSGIMSLSLSNSKGVVLVSSFTTSAFTFTNTSGWLFSLYSESQWEWYSGASLRIGSEASNPIGFNFTYPSST